MKILRNAWYMAAWVDELGSGRTLKRAIADVPYEFSIGVDGNPLAVGPDRNRSAVVVRDKIVWIWPGSEETADTGKLVDLSVVSEAPPTAFFCGYMTMAAHYLLGVDNIMDLSHADFVHPESLGGGSITRAGTRVSRSGDTIHVVWEGKNEVAFPIFDRAFPQPGMKVDFCTEVTWYPPTVMILRTRAAPAGESFENWIDLTALHTMTPESEFKTHYFYAASRNYARDNAELNAIQDKAVRAAFEFEDKPIIEAQQEAMGTSDFWSLQPVLLPIDAGVAQARRLLEQMIRREA